MTRATPPSIPLLHSRYRIEEQLGAGRLAVVYRAYDERLQRAVLIHMLRKELIDQEPLKQRFVQEAHTAARRSHQSLLEIFDSGEIAGRPYMVTEYVAGRTLRELGALSLEEALLYFRQLVGAVAACQAAGVPHPPISSNNVVLVEDGHVELLENWRTPPAQIALDTACYRPPERAAGQPPTHASAVYSLGLLLIEMLTGRRVIDGDDPRAVAQQHLNAHIPALSEIRPLIHAPTLERLLREATSRYPEDRPADAAALGAALDEIRRELSGETRRLAQPPVQPPSLRQRVSRSASQILAPQPASQPAPPSLPEHERPVARAARRATAHPSRGRSITGVVILLTMLLVFACGGYYGVSLIAEKLANIELPRPALGLPNLGIEWPAWLTGIASGGGQVWVVNIEGPEGLNLRKGPGTDQEIVTFLPSGTHVRQIDAPRVAGGVEWLNVRAEVNGQEVEGWVSKLYLKPA
jgi:serine/threonine protein kinase